MVFEDSGAHWMKNHQRGKGGVEDEEDIGVLSV